MWSVTVSLPVYIRRISLYQYYHRIDGFYEMFMSWFDPEMEVDTLLYLEIFDDMIFLGKLS